MGEWMKGYLTVRLAKPLYSLQREFIFHASYDGRLAVCEGPRGGGASYGRDLYLALNRIVDPYIFGGKPRPKEWRRRRLLDSEKKLLDTIRGR